MGQNGWEGRGRRRDGLCAVKSWPFGVAARRVVGFVFSGRGGAGRGGYGGVAGGSGG